MIKITKVSKKMLAMIMSLLMIFSCMAVSASAADAESVTVTLGIPVPVCELNDAHDTITVTKPSSIHYSTDGNDYAVVLSIAPSEGVTESYDANGNTLYTNLKLGTTYVVTATLVDEIDDGVDVAGVATTSVPVLYAQEAPAAPVPAEITSTSITVTAVSGCQYIIRNADGTATAYDWADSTGTDAIKFADLSAETYYVIAAKRKATDTHYESAETTITVKTKAVGKGEAAVPALEDKTNTTITVAAVDGVEYSIDGGKTWQASNEFTGLKANTQYEIIARYAYDSKTEDPSTASAALVVKTNAAANYEAKKASIKFGANVGDYSDAEVTFTVAGDGPADMNNVQYGDTRIIPVSYKVVFGTEEIKASTAFTGTKVTNTGSFTAAEYAEKVVTVKVTFASEEYKGKDAAGNAVWETSETFTESYDVTMSRANTTENKAKGVLEVILNFLLNTVPAFFAKAFQSDVWARLLKALGDLGKAMG